MATISVSAVREQLAQAIETAQTEAVFVERQGRRVAVLVSPERYDELMEALEDAEGAAAFDAAMREDGPNVPWERVEADPDLTCCSRKWYPPRLARAGPPSESTTCPARPRRQRVSDP